MGFEIPVDVDYFEHPKTLFLVGLAGACADVYPLRLWRWCALYAKNGFIRGGKVQIEAAVKWTGDPGALHSALMKAGFLERDGKTVHDWNLHIGRSILLYERKKQKQREKYSAGILPEETGRIPPIPSHPIQDEINNPPLPPKGERAGNAQTRKRRRQHETAEEIEQRLKDLDAKKGAE